MICCSDGPSNSTKQHIEQETLFGRAIDFAFGVGWTSQNHESQKQRYEVINYHSSYKTKIANAENMFDKNCKCGKYVWRGRSTKNKENAKADNMFGENRKG